MNYFLYGILIVYITIAVIFFCIFMQNSEIAWHQKILFSLLWPLTIFALSKFSN